MLISAPPQRSRRLGGAIGRNKGPLVFGLWPLALGLGSLVFLDLSS